MATLVQVMSTNSLAAVVPNRNSTALATVYTEPRWYAAYTRANHEKRVFEQLEGRAVESFLPLYESVSRWKDRRVRLELPLFQGYVFVHVALQERLRVLQVPGVVRLVGFGGVPAPLPDEQMDAMRIGLLQRLRAEPHPYITVGRRIRVTRGPLQGAQGILMRKKGLFRVVLSLNLIMRAVAVEVDASDIEPITQTIHPNQPR
jgi:transcription antitermination factor NusG